MAKKDIPFEFVMDELSELGPMTKPMFGAYGVYVQEQIKVILRDREKSPNDNGIWIATTGEHHQSLQKDLPSMRSIEMFGPGPTGWQVLPKDAEDFEELALKICEMIRQGDIRVGKVPKKKLRKAKKRESKAPISSNAKSKKKSLAKPKKPLKKTAGSKSGKKSPKTSKKSKR